jgi:hypothetical protein
MALDRPMVAASWPSSWRRKTRGGARVSLRERKGEGRVGRPKATGPAQGRGEVEAGWGEEGKGRPVELAGPKAKCVGKASQAESEK